MPILAEPVKDALQHTEPAHVEKLDAEFLQQFATYGRLGCLAEVDASAQRAVESLILGRVVALEDEQILTTAGDDEGDRADRRHPLKLSERRPW